MNKLTIEQIKSNDAVSTQEIESDIADTEIEIKDFQDEKEVLMRNPPENKVRIYLLEGKILQRQNFIDKLNQILEYRNSQK